MAASFNRAIDIEKLLLMLGVVLAHSSFIADYDDISPLGAKVLEFGSSVAVACVPVFFVLSGYLFFRGVERFSPRIYKEKLCRRVRSLLVPYLLWNLIAAGTLFVKAKFLGYPGFGVVTAHGIDPERFLCGFWNLTDGFPYEFAFWFIRNLIVIVVLSPVAWLLASKRWILPCVFAVLIAGNYNLYGLEYFSVGALITRQQINLSTSRISLLFFIIVTLLLTFIPTIPHVTYTLQIARNLLGINVFYNAACKISTTGWGRTKWFQSLVSATFIIYAAHSLYCTLLRKTVSTLIGVTTLPTSLLSYLLTWLLLVLSTWCISIFLHRCFPRLTLLLTGGRR